MNREDARHTAWRIGETLLVLGLALLFFLVVLGLLRVVFPSGSGLQETGTPDGGVMGLDRSVRTLLRLSRGEEDQPVAPGNTAAVLVQMTNAVKSRRVNALSWVPAQEGQALQSRDAVQTLARSGAVIRFDARNTLQMGSNSLVIIKAIDRDPIRDQRRTVLVMIDGELRGRIEPTGGSEFVEVALPSGTARIATATRDRGDTVFKLSVNADQSSTLAVYQGAAELVGRGQRVRVGANQASTMKLDEAPGAPVELPGRPQALAPVESDRILYRDLSPRVRFRWNAVARVSAYRVVIARDEAFTDVAADERVGGTEFAHGNLREGAYYWRVSGLIGHVEGPPSAPQMITLVRDVAPPLLHVDFPPSVVAPHIYALSGMSEPGAHVFVGGAPATVAQTGEFESEVAIDPGPNVIVVEAVDGAGNVTYQSEVVDGKF